jgi:hypothetical protein
MRATTQFLFLLAIGCYVSACAVLQGDNKEKKAQDFMTEFQKALKGPDLMVLQLFETTQSQDAVLAAINILQNNDTAFVKCVANFSGLTIKPGEPWMQEQIGGEVTIVTIPASFTPTIPSGNPGGAADLVFWLTEKDKKMKIVSLEANEFYNIYTSIKNDLQYLAQKEEERKRRAHIYEAAQMLEQKFDSVVWYTVYGDKPYFYVISGMWDERYFYPDSKYEGKSFKMGLVDETGKILIPLECDLIGTIGFDVEDAVEVKGPYGYGYFSLSGDTLVPAEYSQIIPHTESEGWIVKSGEELGWYGDNKKYVSGLPSKKVEEYASQFKFLPEQVTINSDLHSLLENPREESAGSGTFIAPSYWVQLGITAQVIFDITTTHTDAPIGGFTEYVEVNQSVFEKLTDELSLLVVHFRERYLEGREEFYERNKVVIADGSVTTLFTDDEISGTNIQFTRIDSSVFEIRSTISQTNMMDGATAEYTEFKYFTFGNGMASRASSNRTYPETEFAFMDSTYLSGTFYTYDENSDVSTPYYFKSIEVLSAMRQEVISANGLDSKYEALIQFTKKDLPDLADNELHNLNFLARMIQISEEQQGELEGD